jgi:hypothetical protein
MRGGLPVWHHGRRGIHGRGNPCERAIFPVRRVGALDADSILGRGTLDGQSIKDGRPGIAASEETRNRLHNRRAIIRKANRGGRRDS